MFNLKILLFAGTTEGRELCEFFAQMHCKIDVSVASEYGEILLPDSEWIKVYRGRMDREQILNLLLEEKYSLVLDATHPYAAEVTGNLTNACLASNTEYIRIIREVAKMSESYGVWVDSVKDAVDFLSDRTGIVLVTTGSKELTTYTAISDYKERFIFRVLPSAEAMLACSHFQIPPQHRIGIQGPLSEEMNYIMMTDYKVSFLVTKESGSAGGFEEKMKAAVRAGVIPVVIRRPLKERGVSVSQLMDRWKEQR